MIAVAVLGVLMALPLACLSPEGRIFRKRANALDAHAAGYRELERRARLKGDLVEADRCRVHAEQIEEQARIHREASWHR